MWRGEFIAALVEVRCDLFAGISGAPANGMFAYTFYGCESLTYIPANLFAGVSGAPAENMFNSTFAGCTSLRTIPEELFASLGGGGYIGGAAFMATFAGSGIESIPENLFGNITSSLKWGVFMQTFAYCPNLTGPSARINGVYLYNIWPDATEEQVYGMYEGSTGLDDYACIPYAWGGGGEECDSSSSTPSAPEDAVYDFYLTTTSDTDVFAMQISAIGEFYIDWGDGKTEWVTKPDTTDTTYTHNYATAGAYTIGIGGQARAYNTDENIAAISFYVGSNTSAQKTNIKKIASIDGSLGAIFGTVSSGIQKQPRFYMTFSGASNMTGSIPSGLFAGISGAPASQMFNYTFYGCSGLTSIPENLFGNISGTAQNYMFYRTFYKCTSLTGPSARINGQYLYEIWPDATSDQVGDMYYNATKLDDYACIPYAWGGGGKDCSAPPAEFTLTTTPDTKSFSFKISAAGEFVVNWGDGTVETITKPDTTDTTYTHNYDTANTYTIGIDGQATAYNTDETTAAISFYVGSSASAKETNVKKIAFIDGSLVAIFGTLSSDTNNQPRFCQTFKNASNMRGSIPSDLFAGISGAPASYMFEGTFAYCRSLTGAIPAGLFAGISGAPASYMFQNTFYGCSKLTSIPENLFGNISGTAQSNMFRQTFYNCTSLTGPSARINGQYLYEIWPDATSTQVGDMYYNATGLSDYSSIPSVWK